MIRTFSELRSLETFKERFEYLSLKGRVGRSTFGFDRHLNQKFYRSSEWHRIRSYVITRDLGCDLGITDREIHKGLLIHHMNPMETDDIVQGNHDVLDPEYLITTCQRTHNAIHYGDDRILIEAPPDRTPGDTRLW